MLRVTFNAWHPGRSGGHLTPDAVGRWYARTLHRNAHSLRHRFAGLAYRQGHDIASVRQLLGHASVATTQRYIAVGADEMRAAAAGAWIEAS